MRERGQEQTDWFKRVIDVLTLLTLLGGFYFAYDQATKINESIRQSQRSNELAMVNSIAGQWLELDKVFINHPEMRPYFYSKRETDDTSDPIIRPFAIYVLDFIDYAEGTAAEESRQLSIIHPDSWNASFLEIFANSPAVCRELFRNKMVYAKSTRDLGNLVCDPRTKVRPGPPS